MTMQSYQLDLLDEKALVILRGLEQLRIITLKPLTEPKANNALEDHTIPTVDEPGSDDKLSNFKKLQGSINLDMTREEIDVEIDEMREGWR